MLSSKAHAVTYVDKRGQALALLLRSRAKSLGASRSVRLSSRGVSSRPRRGSVGRTSLARS